MIDLTENYKIIRNWRLVQVWAIVWSAYDALFYESLWLRVACVVVYFVLYMVANFYKWQMIAHTQKIAQKIERCNRIERAVEMRWKE